jgi:hypothetical protein
MTPVERGAYCRSCSKEVMDFTAMSDNELLHYFEKGQHQSSCGRFRNDQLNKPLIYISPAVLLMNIPLWKKFLAALFICFSGILTSCHTKESYSNITESIPPPVTQTISSVIQETPAEIPVPDTKDHKKKKAGKKRVLDETITMCTAGNFKVENIPVPAPDPGYMKYLLAKYKE